MRPTDTQAKRPYRMVARAEAAEATRERLLAAAWKRFSERPFHDVRLADVAQDAGVTVQTLHARAGSQGRALRRGLAVAHDARGRSARQRAPR